MLLTKPVNRLKYITTGVHCANSVSWLWDEDSIDLLWDPDDCPDDSCFDTNGPQLYGSWIKKSGKYSPSREEDYSAVYDPDFNTIQVVRSKYVIRCHHCSPCFPNQGDADTDGDLWAYCLPPEIMDEDWLSKNSHRFFYRHKSLKGNYYWKKWKS